MRKLPLAILLLVTTTASAAWPPPTGLPLTRWAREVTPDKTPLPEYPRPQLVRAEWQNLNGMWDYAITPKESPTPAKYEGKILVPFSPQSYLSQVNKPVDEKSKIYYHRTFELPANWKDLRILLNFGAVNWETHVWLNDKEVATHTGGYDGFTVDITDALVPTGPQHLIVSAFNPIEGGQPHGKQALKPDGIFYTPTTGIWQTVWLEPVPKSHIDNLLIVPDVDKSVLTLTVNTNASEPIEAIVLAEGKEVARTTGKAGQVLSIPIPNPNLWWPVSPFLYDLKITSGADTVTSYFGMRKISVGPDDKGFARILLNNKPVYQNGFLDQGFWPDGVYTAPTDEALRYDLEMLRKIGFNMDRKHIKVEPDRWYYWADKLGVLVWQDMPSCTEMAYPPNKSSIPNPEDNYESELRRMIRGRANHPCIVMWILFNEGWGLPTKDRKSDKEKLEASPVAKARIARMVKVTRSEDPTRLIDPESGTGGGGNDHREDLWDIGEGDVVDYHCYGHDGPVAEKTRAGIVGEYGWGLSPVGALHNRLEADKDAHSSGAVLTQITDVENEHNGALKYDRTPIKEVESAKDLPGEILKLLHQYNQTSYPGGE